MDDAHVFDRRTKEQIYKKKSTTSVLRNCAASHGSRTTATEPTLEEIANGSADTARIQHRDHISKHGRQCQEEHENTSTDGHPFHNAHHIFFRFSRLDGVGITFYDVQLRRYSCCCFVATAMETTSVCCVLAGGRFCGPFARIGVT